MSLTSQQLQELARFKTAYHSINAQSQQAHVKQIQSMADDLIKIIKTQENVFSLEFKKIFTRQKHKQNMSEKLQKHYCTERNSRQKHQTNHGHFHNAIAHDWMTVADFGQQTHDNQQKDSFFLDQHLETSEYVLVPYEQYENPEQFQKHQYKRQFDATNTKTMQYAKKGNKNQTKIKALPIKHQNLTPYFKEVQKQFKTTPSTQRMQKKLSQSLISPVKNFKKHILLTVKQKRQIEEQELAMLLNKPKIELSQFYQSNQDHIPVYKKSKMLQIKKMQNIEAHTMHKFDSELNQSTFHPQVNKNTQKLIEGKRFDERQEKYGIKRQENQQKIIYEILQDFPFKPKLNPGSLVESRIKKIWQVENAHNEPSQVIEENDDESDDTQVRREKNRDFFALRVEQKEAEGLFAD